MKAKTKGCDIMFNKKKQLPEKGKHEFWLTDDEINLFRECMMRTENYYRGLLLLKKEWNPELNKETIAIIKAKLNMIDQLQEVFTYEGQPEEYKNMK